MYFSLLLYTNVMLFQNSTQAVLSACQHSPIGKIPALRQNSTFKYCMQVCFLSSVYTAMQYERAADFVAVLSHTVKVRGKGGDGKNLLVVWVETRELML